LKHYKTILSLEESEKICHQKDSNHHHKKIQLFKLPNKFNKFSRKFRGKNRDKFSKKFKLMSKLTLTPISKLNNNNNNKPSQRHKLSR